MVAVGLQVRRAVQADQRQIANLMYFEGHVHRHLDWRAPLDWLGSPHYWLLEEGNELVAALACPEDPPGIAWIRLFTCASTHDIVQAWSRLWEAARQELGRDGMSIAAAISLQDWFQDLLRDSRFRFNQDIIMLEWEAGPHPEVQPPAGVYLRRMQPGDLPSVAEVDSSAFEPLWRNTLDALERAFPQSLYASVAEGSGGLLGYQLSTGNPRGAHLARLAVRPEAQGTGIGGALVSDLIQHLGGHGRVHITVNTQSDNQASQTLYERMGFHPTGERYPVFVHPL